MERARANRKRIVLPESTDDRILEAAAILPAGGGRFDLAGDEKRFAPAHPRWGWISTRPRSSRRAIRNWWSDSRRPTPRRAHKGMTIERAREIIPDVSYFGTMMVHLGLADGMVSGAINTTAHTIRPALEFVKTKPG